MKDCYEWIFSQNPEILRNICLFIGTNPPYSLMVLKYERQQKTELWRVLSKSPEIQIFKRSLCHLII